MYTVEFYETEDGNSELWTFLETLRKKAATSKDARIQYKQISLYIQLLQDNGTRLNESITKHPSGRHLGTASWQEPHCLFLL